MCHGYSSVRMREPHSRVCDHKAPSETIIPKYGSPDEDRTIREKKMFLWILQANDNSLDFHFYYD